MSIANLLTNNRKQYLNLNVESVCVGHTGTISNAATVELADGKCLLLNRISTAQRNFHLIEPGLFIYNTDTQGLQYSDQTQWFDIATGPGITGPTGPSGTEINELITVVWGASGSSGATGYIQLIKNQNIALMKIKPFYIDIPTSSFITLPASTIPGAYITPDTISYEINGSNDQVDSGIDPFILKLFNDGSVLIGDGSSQVLNPITGPTGGIQDAQNVTYSLL